jgi:DNA-binding CsgD family transcriptional regulator
LGRHNLPAPRSSFIGRETEVRKLKRDLAMTRLLTLTGAGGCGKTRLALEVARDLVGAYPDGVWLVELAPLSEGALITQALASVLGLKEQPDRSLTDALVGSFEPSRRSFSEGRRWLEKEGCASSAVRAKALYAVSLMAHRQYDTSRAEIAAREGLKLSAEPQFDGSLAASFRIMLGRAARLRGDFRRAKPILEEGLELSREADDRLGIADALRELAAVSSLIGDRAKAKALYEEGIALCRELGYRLRLGDFLHILGDTLLLEGDYERGAALSEEAAALFRERGDKGGLLYAVDLLGWVALLQDDYARAKTSYQESLMLCIELGDERIASELFLSEHTVHHHITNILKKLNLSSRQQVASRLPDQPVPAE